MEDKGSGIRIGKKAFLTSAAIILALMALAGILTVVIPSGSYARTVTDGRETVVAGSFRFTEDVRYPVWRWLIAPVELLGGPDGGTVIGIAAYILIVGGAFTLLDRCGMLRWLMGTLARRFSGRRYALLALTVGFFMFFGATFGMFEELIALVPIAVMLAYALGWDSLVGLGMSALAAGFGFASALLNPFTVGTAQTLSGVPLFSGIGLRIPIFLLMYGVLFLFVRGYAKKLDADPSRSLVYADDADVRARYADASVTAEAQPENGKYLKRAALIFGGAIALVILYIVAGLIVNVTTGNSALSDLSMIVMALLFLIGGVLSAVASRYTAASKRRFGVLRDFAAGMLAILPGILLILMASSIKYIVSSGGVMDTMLYYAATALSGLGPYAAVLLVFLLVLLMNFFIGSASAKAFLVIPLIAPLTDLIGLTRQTAVQAFCFGDGFSNMLYPTNPVLMIALSMTVVSYVKWFKWTWKLQALVAVLCSLILLLCVAIGYGPV